MYIIYVSASEHFWYMYSILHTIFYICTVYCILFITCVCSISKNIFVIHTHIEPKGWTNKMVQVTFFEVSQSVSICGNPSLKVAYVCPTHSNTVGSLIQSTPVTTTFRGHGFCLMRKTVGSQSPFLGSPNTIITPSKFKNHTLPIGSH